MVFYGRRVCPYTHQQLRVTYLSLPNDCMTEDEALSNYDAVAAMQRHYRRNHAERLFKVGVRTQCIISMLTGLLNMPHVSW